MQRRTILDNKQIRRYGAGAHFRRSSWAVWFDYFLAYGQQREPWMRMVPTTRHPHFLNIPQNIYQHNINNNKHITEIHPLLRICSRSFCPSLLGGNSFHRRVNRNKQNFDKFVSFLYLFAINKHISLKY